MASVYTMETAPPAPLRGGSVGGGGVGNSGSEMLFAALANLTKQFEDQRARREEYGQREKELRLSNELAGKREEAADTRRAEAATPAGKQRANVKQMQQMYSDASGKPLSEVINMSYDAVSKGVYDMITSADIAANSKAMRQRMIDSKLVQDELGAEIAAQQWQQNMILSGAEFERTRALKQAASAVTGYRTKILRYIDESNQEAIQEKVAVQNMGLEAHQRGLDGGLRSLEVVGANPQILAAFMPKSAGTPMANVVGSVASGGSEMPELPPQTSGSRDLNMVQRLKDSWRAVFPGDTDEEVKMFQDYIDSKYLGKALTTEPGPGGDIEEKSTPFSGVSPKAVYRMSAESSGYVAMYDLLRQNNFDVTAALGTIDRTSPDPRVQNLLKLSSSMSPETMQAFGEFVKVRADFVRDARPYAPAAFMKAELAEISAKNLATALEQGHSDEEVTNLYFKLHEVDNLLRISAGAQFGENMGLPKSKTLENVEDLAAAAPNTFGPVLSRMKNDLPAALGVVQGEYAKSLQALGLKDPKLEAAAAMSQKATLYESLQDKGIDPDDMTYPPEIRSVWRNLNQKYEESFPGTEVTPRVSRITAAEIKPPVTPPANDALGEFAKQAQEGKVTEPIAAPTAESTTRPAGYSTDRDDPATTLMDKLLSSESVKGDLAEGEAYRDYLSQTVTVSAINRDVKRRAEAQFKKTQQETGVGAGGSVMDMLPPGMKQSAEAPVEPPQQGQPRQQTRPTQPSQPPQATSPAVAPTGPARPPVNAADAFNRR